MKATIVLTALAALVIAKTKIPTPSGSPPPLPIPSHESALPIPSSSSAAIPEPFPPSEPAPIPPPLTPTGIPVPSATVSTLSGEPHPTETGNPDQGPICQCGYTYCASVLTAMKKPWTHQELTSAYCNTPDAPCPNNQPATNATSALYICLCGNPNQKLGSQLSLLCGCNNCLNIAPDYRGRCDTPCFPGHCK